MLRPEDRVAESQRARSSRTRWVRKLDRQARAIKQENPDWTLEQVIAQLARQHQQ